MAAPESESAAARRSWIRRHKILTGLATTLALFLLPGVLGAVGSPNPPAGANSKIGPPAGLPFNAKAAPASATAPSMDPAAMTSASNASYALPGYELGVRPVTSGAVPVCPYEVGSWNKSIVSDNASLSVSARGPVSLEAVSITNSGVRHTQDFAIDASHAVATVDLADVPAADLQVIMLTASNGGNGAGETCAVAPAGGTLTGVQYCQAKKWPQLVPNDVIGLDYSEAIQSYRELGCMNVDQALSENDGHDVGNDPAGRAAPYVVDKVSPGAGSAVMTATTVNLRLRSTS